MGQMDRLDIALGFDGRYAPHAANVMTSIVRHAPGAKFRFILLQCEVSAEQKRRMEIAVPGQEIVWVDVNDGRLPSFATRGHLNRAILFRLGLEKLAPEDCERVLYVDSDVVVLGDICDLFRSYLDGRPLGAVTDCYQEADKFAELWSLPAGGRYFNSGVLLIDLKQVRQQKLFSKALDFVVEHDAKLLFSDQDALNYVFWKNTAVLEPVWNVQRHMSNAEIAAETAPDRRWGRGRPYLVHYVGAEKPWMRNIWHPWAWLYWENMLRTPFAKEVREQGRIDTFQLARYRARWMLGKPDGALGKRKVTPVDVAKPWALPITGVIDVAFGFDKNYAPHAGAVISSVIGHAPGARFRFIILHMGIDRALQERVESCAPGMAFVWIEVGDDDVPAFADRQHFTRATLFRFGLEKLAPADCHRLLYLDADIAVRADVRELWSVDLGGEPVGAAIDSFVDPVRFSRMWKLEGLHDYFNAGILVIDLDRVRSEKAFTKAAEFVATNDPELNDQDGLNYVFWGRWKRVDVAWNAQRHTAIPSLVEDLTPDKRLNGQPPKIIHFTGPEKPWLPGVYHPWTWVYWRALKRTPFYQEVSERCGMRRLDRSRMLFRWLRHRIV